ncbi:MAG: sensor histidine kinase, partial [Planctomycetota bacterium]
MSNGQLLLIEDSADEARTCSLILERAGYTVFTAATLTEGRATLQSTAIDLILLDLHLHRESGLELLEWLQCQPTPVPAPPSIVVTVSADSDLHLKALKMGAEDVLRKPLNFTELAAKVETHLKVKRLRDRLEEKNRELAETTRNLERSLTLRRQFLTLITHDLRTPITTIKLSAEVLREHLGEGFFSTPEGKRFNDLLTVLLRNTVRVENNFNEVMTIGKLDANELQLTYGPLDLNRLIEDAIATVTGSQLADDRTIHFQPGELPQFSADVKLIQQLLTNLLSITLARTDLTNTATLATTLVGDEVVIRLHDDGPYLEPSYLEEVLEGLSSD